MVSNDGCGSECKDDAQGIHRHQVGGPPMEGFCVVSPHESPLTSQCLHTSQTVTIHEPIGQPSRPSRIGASWRLPCGTRTWGRDQGNKVPIPFRSVVHLGGARRFSWSFSRQVQKMRLLACLLACLVCFCDDHACICACAYRCAV